MTRQRGSLVISQTEKAKEVADLWPMQEYVHRRQSNIAEYIVTRPVFELCNGAERVPEFSQRLRWWDQNHNWGEGGNGSNGGGIRAR